MIKSEGIPSLLFLAHYFAHIFLHIDLKFDITYLKFSMDFKI